MLFRSRLGRLVLQLNQIGDEGCKALAAALGKEGAAPRLEYLDLWQNKIGDEGCTALAAGGGSAIRVYLQENEIGDEGWKALAAALEEGPTTRLEVRGAPPRRTRSSLLNAHRTSPRVQELWVDKVRPELVAVCKKRGIELS